LIDETIFDDVIDLIIADHFFDDSFEHIEKKLWNK
jgi:hypothetical protein